MISRGGSTNCLVGSGNNNNNHTNTITQINIEGAIPITTTLPIQISQEAKPPPQQQHDHNQPLNSPSSLGLGGPAPFLNKFNQPTQFSWNKNEEFHFEVPPEAPVFSPNHEEFKNPLNYISKIRPIAEKYGICKIKPPTSWQPPFTVDVDKLRFTPRIQRLNELEAKTRVKLNFLDQIAKFWELQGSSLKIPMVERKALDLYSLHRIVQEEGGMEQTINNRKWSKVATRMGYPQGKSVGTILKSHYERILYPFDVYTTGKSSATASTSNENNLKFELSESDPEHDYKPHCIESRQLVTPPQETGARRSKRFAAQLSDCDLDDKKSIFNAAAAAVAAALKKQYLEESAEHRRLSSQSLFKSPSKNDPKSRMGGGMRTTAPLARRNHIDPLAKYICHTCNRGDAEESMLLCDGCDDSYHTFCLLPPLTDIPKGDWRCPKCVVEEVNKPIEAFGFEQAQREYTLQQFGEMADRFKSDYFNMPVHLVPTDLVEREFWRIVSSIDEDVTVEYGADLHTMDHGSGFPTKSSLYLLTNDKEYSESSWNLNNLPVLEESILGHINADISGMKVPWMYVGMCFATFCWHNEDHWSYSINYLHWGEPKTWYGVPGNNAEAFEETMKSAAPELFHSQPDLLHQLVTIMNPNILMNAGVPVYRTDQHAGEFVITFPRAYHAGFNQGYNFAEAVNFAPADWMKMGRECINHYSTLRRFCVFSHDELVCKMSLEPDRLNFGIATACYLDMAEMVDSEKKLRKSLLEWGVTKAEREAFELIPDDERQCDVCKTTCFLSAVTCPCSKTLVCLRHYSELCKCAPDKHTLQYRYTLDELPLMLKKLKVKTESFDNWLRKIRDVINPASKATITLDELQELAAEAHHKKFPNSVLLERLNSAVVEAEKCVTVIQQLDINKMRTRTRNASSHEATKYKLTMDELEMFVQEIDNLWCVIREGASVRELQQMGKEFMVSAARLLVIPIDQVCPDELDELVEEGSCLCIELPQLIQLRDRSGQAGWYRRCREVRDSTDKTPVAVLQKLLADGMKVTPHTILERELADLDLIVFGVEEWEKQAWLCYERCSENNLPEIESLLRKGNELKAFLPTYNGLRDSLKKLKEWLTIVEHLQTNENYPYFQTLENVVARGKNIPFQLEELKKMEEHLGAARIWKERTSRTFLKKKSAFTLMEALSPRGDSVMPSHHNHQQSSVVDSSATTNDNPFANKFTEEMSPVQMVIAFKEAEEKELKEMKELRQLNRIKSPESDTFCLCRRRFCGIMFNCQLCLNWFHAGCVPPPRNTVRQRPINSISSPSANRDAVSSNGTSSPLIGLHIPIHREKDRETKYLCPSCLRSRRPRLETILSLLVSLQRLPIRIPEGEALQCLTERAMNWQDRARQILTSGEITKVLSNFPIESTQPPLPAQITGKKNGKNNKKKKSMVTSSSIGDAVVAASAQSSAVINPEETSSDDDEFNLNFKAELLLTGGGGVSLGDEHAYSSEPISEIPIKKTSLFKSSEPALITLTKPIINLLVELMMEGDLLEVSLDETNHIWRILNASKPGYSDLSYIHFKYTIAVQPPPPPPPTTLISSESATALVTLYAAAATSVNKKRKSDEMMTVTVVTSDDDEDDDDDDTLMIDETVMMTSSSSSTSATKKQTAVRRGRKLKVLENMTTMTSSQSADNLNVVMTSLSSAITKTPKSSTKINKKTNSTTTTIKTLIPLVEGVEQQRDNSSVDDERTTSDEDEDCSASKCLRPTGREVDWVQCDGGCEKWFHMLCVGLQKNQIKPDDDFICNQCKAAAPLITNTSKTKTSSTSSSNKTKQKFNKKLLATLDDVVITVNDDDR